MFKQIIHKLDPILDKTVIFGFDRFGYLLRKNLWDPQDLEVDMRGQICVVTGANSGLGYATTRALAERGATVIMACRSRERGEQAQHELIQATHNEQIVLELVDLSLLSSVREFVGRLKAKYTHLDVLINNAGVLLNEKETTEEGFEKSFATNLLGPYVLTQELFPLLAASHSPAGARVIMVSSGGMYLARLHVDDLQFDKRPYNGALAYAEAKRGMLILTKLWARAQADRGIRVNAMHPGWADTPGVQSSLPGFRLLTRAALRNNQEGADTIVWLALKRPLNTTGGFFCDRRERPEHRMESTRNAISEIESYWHKLGELSGCPAPFPLSLEAQ